MQNHFIHLNAGIEVNLTVYNFCKKGTDSEHNLKLLIFNTLLINQLTHIIYEKI